MMVDMIEVPRSKGRGPAVFAGSRGYTAGADSRLAKNAHTRPPEPNPNGQTREKPSLSLSKEDHSEAQTRQALLAKELKEITTLYNTAVTVGSSLNLPELFWALYKESSRLVDTSNFVLAIYDEPGDRLNFVLAFDRGRRLKPFTVRRSKHRGPIARVLARQSPLLVRDALKRNTSSLRPPREREEKVNPVRSWLGVPIRNPSLGDDAVQGVIVVWSYEPNAFSGHDLWLLSAIGTQAAIAIRNARLYQSLQNERDRVVAAEEQTRQALARDLHDGPTQLVSAMLMRLEFCQMVLTRDPAKVGRELTAVQELARQAVQEIRTMLFELRPLILETEGLAAAVAAFIERRQADLPDASELNLRLQTEKPDGQLSRPGKKVEAALFAIIQEAVNNALKHAQAQSISVELRETPTSVFF